MAPNFRKISIFIITNAGDQMLAGIMNAPNDEFEFGLINSISDGPLRNFSPGLHILHHTHPAFVQ